MIIRQRVDDAGTLKSSSATELDIKQWFRKWISRILTDAYKQVRYVLTVRHDKT